jgi:F0F1-type ATP synthase delta subunit
LKEYQRLDAKKSRTGVVVTLAHKRDVEDILSKHHITEKATTKIDETIIGGYHIETQNQLIDATHKNALLTLFQSLTR